MFSLSTSYASTGFKTRPATGLDLSSRIANGKSYWMDHIRIGQMSFLEFPREQCLYSKCSWPTSTTCLSLQEHHCRLFAYNSLLYCVVNKASDCKLLQQDLTTLEQWKVTLQMSFNPSNCTAIRVSTGRKHKYQLTYALHG